MQHKKYFTEVRPILADGDFMGVFVDDRASEINDLVEEGFSREEEVFISSGLSRFISSENLSNLNIFEVSSFECILSFLKNGLRQTSFGKAGVRLILQSDDLFLNLSSDDRRSYLDRILKILMKGELSIAVVNFDTNSLKLNDLSCYPRVMVEGKIFTNKFFVLPQRAMEKKSELAVLFEQQDLDGPQFPHEGGPFPIGVPDMLESIIDSMGVGIVVGDNYGNMILFNRAAQSIIGLPPSPLPYAERIRRFGNYLPDKTTPYPFDQLPLSRAINGESFENELIFIKNENKPEGVWVQNTGRGVKSPEGKSLGGVLVFRDVTEEKRTQEEKEILEKNLVQNQKLESLGVLAGGIAHDFNNLLVGILGNASIVIQQDGVYPSLRPRIEQIQQAGLQLTDLTKQLLIYAGFNPNKEYQYIDLNSLITSTIGLVEASVSKKIHLSLELTSDELGLVGDEVQLKQILLNLAINAADAYGNDCGELLVRTKQAFVDKDTLKKNFFAATEKEGNFVCFEVEDFAGGISKDLVTKIFDPFFSTKGMGRGLGLSAVLGIVKAHQGFLELNTQDGVGTKFGLWFPSSQAVTRIVDINDNQDLEKAKGKTVLLIDDEELVLEVADSILTLNGYKTVQAVSGRNGLNSLKKEKDNLSLIILDMNMPDLSGEDVYREIRKILPTLPIIISSGFSKELCSLDKFKDDKLFFLEKPYGVESLLSMVVRLVN